MFNKEQKITIEYIDNNNMTVSLSNMSLKDSLMTNPFTFKHSDEDKLSVMIKQIIQEELPMIKTDSLLYNLVYYSVKEKMKTVQRVKNVLSYIKESDSKLVKDVQFKNGEIFIKCLI